MPRAKRGFKARRRRNKILKAARGFYGARSRLFAPAIEAVHHAWRYSTRDRKVRKREFRSLWIARVNAAVRAVGIPYGRFMHALKKANVEIDRKILAELAVLEPAAFARIVETSKQAAK
ncbi:MAG: 50S ribosomal protein L20 [Myxococcota bacterium]